MELRQLQPRWVVPKRGPKRKAPAAAEDSCESNYKMKRTEMKFALNMERSRLESRGSDLGNGQTVGFLGNC
jgi:hypothetical protein